MLTVPHAVVGAALASKIQNPILAFPLAILSHYFLDFLVPHWNPHLYTEYHKKGALSKTTKKIVLADGFLAVILVILASSFKLPDLNQALYVFLGASFGVLPDAVEIPHYFLGFKNKILSSYVEFGHRHQRRAPFLPGLLTQLLAVLICLAFLFS